MKFSIGIILSYLLLVVLVFGKLPQTFFQQDEWAITGIQIFAEKSGISLYDRLFIYEMDTHLVPFSNMLSITYFRLFGIETAGYAWMAIIFHMFNTILVFAIARLLTKNLWIAGITGGLFLINSISHQAVTWFATSTGTLGSATFFLVSIFLFLHYLQNERSSSWFLFGTIVSFAISLGFKETSVFGFLLFPLWWLVFFRRKTFRKALVPLAMFGFIGVAYLLTRIFFNAIAPPSVVPPELTQAPLEGYIVRAIAIPLRALAQSVFPLKFMLLFSRELIRLAYPQFLIGGSPDPYVVEGVAADIVSLVVSLFVFLLSFIAAQIFILKKKAEGVRIIILSLLSIAASALPFIAVPGKAGYNALLDGRHLYITGIFSSILVVTVLWGVLLWVGKRRTIVVGILALFFLATSYHALKIRRDIDYQMAIGGLRKSMLQTITTAYPTLPARVVFFIESDAPYYGLPFEEPIVPFQSGFGQTLLVWYSAHGADLPACIFNKKYLYVLLSEDFKECEGQGFGYYRKASTFNTAMNVHTFKPEEVIAFRFTSSTNQFMDVTQEVRNKIVQYGKL